MGAESDYSWIRTGTEKDYDWLDDSCLPGISPDDLPDGMVEKDWMNDTVCKSPGFEGVEGILWSVAMAAGAKWLKEPGDGWTRFLLDRDAVDRLVDKCRELIREAIFIEDQAGWDASVVKNVLDYIDDKWDEDAAEDLCRVLRHLLEAKELLDEFHGYDLVVEIAY